MAIIDKIKTRKNNTVYDIIDTKNESRFSSGVLKPANG